MIFSKKIGISPLMIGSPFDGPNESPTTSPIPMDVQDGVEATGINWWYSVRYATCSSQRLA
jgi:hypothetical protein